MALLLLLLLLVPALVWLLVPGPAGASPLVAYTLPRHLWGAMRDGRRRSHYALAHATINVIEERAGNSLRLSSLADEDGFVLVGLRDAPLALNAARDALGRLQGNEPQLVVRLRSGFTLVAGQAIALGTSLIALVLVPRLVPIGILLGLGLATWLARPASRLLQRTLLAGADVDGLHVARAQAEAGMHPLALLLPGYGRVKVFVTRQQPSSRPTRRYRAY